MFIELLARTGVRWHSEGAALRVKDFDPLERTLRVYASKTGQTRVFPIAGLAEKTSTHIKRFGSWDPEALIFTTETGQRINAQNFRRRVFQPASKRAGITYPGWRLYDLRHYACSTALEEGVSASVAAAMSGHSVDMLHRVYAHALQEAQKRAADVLEQAWNRPLSDRDPTSP